VTACFDDLHLRVRPYEALGAVEELGGVARSWGDDRKTEHGLLAKVVIGHFARRDAKASSRGLYQVADDRTLGLERGALREVKLDPERGNMHALQPASPRGGPHSARPAPRRATGMDFAGALSSADLVSPMPTGRRG
jgi:hypothetical protein